MLFSLKQEASASIGGGTFTSDDIQKVVRLAEMIEENAFVMLKKHIEKSDYDMEDTKTFGLIKEIQDKAYNILCVLEER